MRRDSGEGITWARKHLRIKNLNLGLHYLVNETRHELSGIAGFAGRACQRTIWILNLAPSLNTTPRPIDLGCRGENVLVDLTSQFVADDYYFSSLLIEEILLGFVLHQTVSLGPFVGGVAIRIVFVLRRRADHCFALVVLLTKGENKSIGTGRNVVVLCSLEISRMVWRKRSWSAIGSWLIMLAA